MPECRSYRLSLICKGILAQSFSCKKLSNLKHAANTVRNTNKKNNYVLNAGQDKRISIYQTYFVFVPIFSKSILTMQIMLSTTNSQEFLASQVSVFEEK